eukprot:Hpha_TRINITY_DN2458_c0_g1::TRINITY_DN2458_c0_g1_i1::g.24682::m.24682
MATGKVRAAPMGDGGKGNRSYMLTGGLIFIAVMGLGFLHQTPDPNRHAVQRYVPCRLRAPAAEEGPMVCSHKGFHGAWDAPVGSPLYPPPGNDLLRSMRWHVDKLNVRCFDLDVSVTSDGGFLVGHPKDTMKALQLNRPLENYTVRKVRAIESELGAKNVAPGLGEVVMEAHRLGVRVLTLEPKKTLAATSDFLRGIAHRVSQLQRPWLKIYLILYNDHETAKKLSKDFPEMHFALASKDKPVGLLASACKGETPAAEALEGFDMIMPSVTAWEHCRKHLEPEIKKRRIRVHTWVVDDASAVSQATGSDAVITNKPAGIAPNCAK